MDIRQILQQHGFKFNKQFGQNFLCDNLLLDEIVDMAGITQSDTVLEIGAGAGTLTAALAKTANKVVAIEIDNNLKPVLAATVGKLANVEVVFADIMKMSQAQVEILAGNKGFKVVANIPYYITSPLIMRFVESDSAVESLTLTIQKEVAERLAARHNTADFGAITVAVQAVADVEILKILDRQLFFPVPNVDSAVVKLTLKRNKFDIKNHAMLRKTIKSAFAMRRKTLVNNLAASFGFGKEQAERILTDLNLDTKIRGEALSVGQFVELANYLQVNNC